ncbi:uncharacterized protein LOC142344821 [Convolutriloba macropyga]|uniref:uncharacterized protein LOC142344821 n=1 Tax=Convolutriloba macropyga TaxID=536237 RepID=UPI003F52780D
MVTQRPFNLTYAGLQLVTVAFLIVAVFLNQWIKGVRKDEEDNRGYFSRVEDLPFGLFVGGDFGGDFDDGIYSSVGLFRIIASGDTSYSLPIIDPELDLCKGGLMVCILLSSGTLYTTVLQSFNLFTGNFPFEVVLFWSTIIQMMLTFVSTLVGMLYFKENFSYDKAGMSLFAGWIAFALSALLVAVASFKVYIAHGENKERRKEKEQLAKQSIYERTSTVRSTGSQSQIYQPVPSSRPGTADKFRQPEYSRESSRPGTVQSQHRYETYGGGAQNNDYPMRRAPSQDSKQFEFPRQQSPPARREVEYRYTDQGDIPRYGSHGRL